MAFSVKQSLKHMKVSIDKMNPDKKENALLRDAGEVALRTIVATLKIGKNEKDRER